MTMEKEPAFPFTWANRDGDKIIESGLTKREYMATKMMVAQRIAFSLGDAAELAKDAIKDADELLKQLDK